MSPNSSSYACPRSRCQCGATVIFMNGATKRTCMRCNAIVLLENEAHLPPSTSTIAHSSQKEQRFHPSTLVGCDSFISASITQAGEPPPVMRAHFTPFLAASRGYPAPLATTLGYPPLAISLAEDTFRNDSSIKMKREETSLERRDSQKQAWSLSYMILAISIIVINMVLLFGSAARSYQRQWDSDGEPNQQEILNLQKPGEPEEVEINEWWQTLFNVALQYILGCVLEQIMEKGASLFQSFREPTTEHDLASKTSNSAECSEDVAHNSKPWAPFKWDYGLRLVWCLFIVFCLRQRRCELSKMNSWFAFGFDAVGMPCNALSH